MMLNGMNHILRKTGIFALTTGGFVYVYHARKGQGRVLAHQRDDSQVLTTEICPPEEHVGRAKVPSTKAKEGPLVLQLKQVQVMFRHGARTPLHTMPKVPEVEYDAEFMTRDHQACVFPYERVSCVDGSPVDYGRYQANISQQPLRGGASAGSLTTLGKDQMYLLGHRLRDCYKSRLDIATYDADEISILSSNVRRTVESAQCVLAGIYGKEQLIDFAENCHPVKILISNPKYNILIPNTHSCGVLQKNNYSAMVHPDFMPGFKDMRLEVEEHIMKPRELLLEGVTEAQVRINSMQQFYESEGLRSRRLELNIHGQHYQHDALLQPLYDERGRAIRRVDRFWANILNRDRVLRDILTEEDMKALIYLRDLRVEEFEGTLASGYRIHFYFDKNNPYFYNTHICKEMFTRVNPVAPPSKQTPIMWRPDRRLIPEEVEQREVEEEQEKEEDFDDKDRSHPCVEKPKIKYAQPPSCRPEPTVEVPEPKVVPDSFFHWLVRPTVYDLDVVAPAIMGDVWKDPESLLENEPKVRDPWDDKFHFVFSRDDAVARITHGWWYPLEAAKYRHMTEKNATTVLHRAMVGVVPETRCVVTRLSAGPLLTEMLEQSRKVICGGKAPKLCLYSSHDSTMTALMEALGIWDEKWPPFGSDLRLELYKEVDGCEYYVRVLYNGKEKRIRNQTESYMHWGDFCNAVKRFVIHRDETERICRSNILERIAKEVLRQEKGEKALGERTEEEDVPAGM